MKYMSQQIACIGIGVVMLVSAGVHAEDFSCDNLTIATNVTQSSSAATNVFMGKVGIGTASPASPLHVEGSANVDSLVINNGLADGGNFGLYSSGYSSWYVDNYLGSYRIYTIGNERLRIKSTGDMGIGESAPLARLHVKDTDNPVVMIERSTADTSTYKGTARFLHTTSGNMADGFGSVIEFSVEDATSGVTGLGFIGAVRAGADTTGDLVFRPRLSGSSNEKMRITSAGKVGIGTTSPSETLHIDGTARFDDGITYVPALGDLSMGSYTNSP